MTRNDWEQFRERWRLVAEAERDELRDMPMELKLRQVAALMQSALGLGWDTQDETQINAVRERWRRLREAFRG